MPTFLLLELSDPDALPLPFLDPGVKRVVLRSTAPTLADFANALEDAQVAPVDEDEEAAVIRRLVEKKPAAARAYGVRPAHLRAYPGLNGEGAPEPDRPLKDYQFVSAIVEKMRVERQRAQPNGPAYHGDPGDAADVPLVVPGSKPADDDDGGDADDDTDFIEVIPLVPGDDDDAA